MNSDDALKNFHPKREYDAGYIDELKNSGKPYQPDPDERPSRMMKRRLYMTGLVKLRRESGQGELVPGDVLVCEVTAQDDAYLVVGRITDERILLKPVGFKLDKPTPKGATAEIDLGVNHGEPDVESCAVVPGSSSSIILIREG